MSDEIKVIRITKKHYVTPSPPPTKRGMGNARKPGDGRGGPIARFERNKRKQLEREQNE